MSFKENNRRMTLEKQLAENRQKFSRKIKKIGRIFFCSVCPFKSVISLRAKIHSLRKCGEEIEKNRKKSSNKKIKCYLCSLTFPSKKEKQIHHRRCHQQPIPCSKCGLKLKSHNNWVTHITEVCGNKPKAFSCNQCNYSTHRQFNLQRHRRTKHKAAAPSPILSSTVSSAADSEEGVTLERETEDDGQREDVGDREEERDRRGKGERGAMDREEVGQSLVV